MAGKCGKRPCAACKRWFAPNPRAGGRQTVCDDARCRRERHRRACAKWRAKNPGHDAAQRLRKRLDGTVERAQQQALLAEPRSYLDAHRGGTAAPPHDPRLGVRANRLRRQAAQTTEALARLQRLVQEVAVAELQVVERQVLGPAVRQVARVAGQAMASALGMADAMEKADAK